MALGLLLGAPFVLVASAAAGLVGPFTRTVVSVLLQVTAPLAPLTAPQLEPEAEVGSSGGVALAFEAARKSPAQRAGKARAASKPAALFVSEATVLRLAQSGARPQGSFVTQTEEHPAGLRLSGVAALSIGVQDGDILIEALGVTPRSPGEIIGAVIEARAKQVRFLSGKLWRHGQTFGITVEQPYLGHGRT